MANLELEINKLIELKNKNEQIYENFYKQVFGKDFDVRCDWGFPNLLLTVAMNKNGKKSEWIFNINTTKASYILKTKSEVMNEKTGNWITDYATISGDTINYVVDSAVELSTKVLKPNISQVEEEKTKINYEEETNETNETEETKKVE